MLLLLQHCLKFLFYFVIGLDAKTHSKERYDYLEEEYVDLDQTDLSSKDFSKENLQDTQATKKLKVEKHSRRQKTTEGSGEPEYGMTREDDEDSDDHLDEKEGSGMDNNILRSSRIHQDEYSNEISHHVDKKALNMKFGK